jgi:hypothetical protein
MLNRIESVEKSTKSIKGKAAKIAFLVDTCENGSLFDYSKISRFVILNKVVIVAPSLFSVSISYSYGKRRTSAGLYTWDLCLVPHVGRPPGAIVITEVWN